MATRKSSSAKPKAQTGAFVHADAKAIIRPEVGVQSHAAARPKFRREPTTYVYDSSLAPQLQWDALNPAREQGEALIARIADLTARLGSAAEDERAALIAELQRAADELKALSRPFLEWSGKAERTSFEVPTLPLFIHERLSTPAILETLKGHRASRQADWLNDLFGNPDRPAWEQLAKSYEHANGWSNRLILGDSLVVMNSLLQFERMRGEVQMIYMDPPYGVKFGSNFQPFVRKRDVTHNDDEDFTREPEMVKAYRDTWELGLHSYLTYLRDRLLLCRELLADSGSIFVQISDENLHHVREVMDEVFGGENCCGVIVFKKTSGAGSPSLGTDVLASVADYILWYARSRDKVKFRQLYQPKRSAEGEGAYTWVDLPNNERRRMTPGERDDPSTLPGGAKVFRADNLTSQSGVDKTRYPVEIEGKVFRPTKGVWKTSEHGMRRLLEQRRVVLVGNTPSYVRYFSDFPVQSLSSFWEDTVIAGFADPKVYVVQTSTKVIERCLLMTTDPGDLVLDPTCGSGTTAYVAEAWGRRWITMDTSRVPLALARQRLLTATYDWQELKEPARGPAGGFVYKEKKNRNGEHVGGIVPHITLKSIANNEPPAYEVLVDRPEIVKGVTRVTGRFTAEATIPTAQPVADGAANDETLARDDDWTARMIGVLRASPVLHLTSGRTLRLAGVREPAQALTLSAEAMELAEGLDSAIAQSDAASGGLALEGGGAGQPVALLFGPENGALTEALVRAAHDEASMKSRGYKHLYVIGFAIEPRARDYIEHAAQLGVAATYVQATPDVLMGDLLKNMRSSQIFSVCGLPDVSLLKAAAPDDEKHVKTEWWQVRLDGLDVFDPASQQVDHRSGLDVPAWLLDTNYNGMVFHVCQAFFPRTAAWDGLKRSLKAEFDEGVWQHLAGDLSAPFPTGSHGCVAVKVIDDRGNELMVVKELRG
jgi:adenine-specific DNA-methyltransferase